MGTKRLMKRRSALSGEKANTVIKPTNQHNEAELGGR